VAGNFSVLAKVSNRMIAGFGVMNARDGTGGDKHAAL
jgi:hypothetical protein